MNVQAEVSLYPLGTAALMDFTNPLAERLRRGGLGVQVAAMSSRVSGQCKDVFQALSKAFEVVAQTCDVAVMVKVTDACGEVAGAIPGGREVRPAPTPAGGTDENATRGITVRQKEEP